MTGQNKTLHYGWWLLAGLLLFLFMWFGDPFSMGADAAPVLAIATLMVFLWVTEALPMPVVALMPLVLFPLFDILTLRETASGYADPIIFLFMGGFMIGLAIEKWNLHTRIALVIIRATGSSGDRIILGFILATGFLSMWLSNTATTVMMFPIAASLIHVVRENRQGQGNIDHFSLAVMLSIAYAANFGGIATIIGTPPNVAFVAFIQKKYDYTVQFADWLLICGPIALLLLISLYWVLTKWLYPNRLRSDAAINGLIQERIRKLGPLRQAEQRVLIVFCATALLWIVKDLINRVSPFRLDDTMIAMAGAIVLFLLPSGKTEKGKTRLLEWQDTSRMAWGILILFGGGIALATSLEKAGLIGRVGEWIAGFSGGGVFLLVLMIALVSLFVSELMSNIAQVIVFSPVIAGVAEAMGLDALLLGIPMTLAASCASMMPMGTPPNAIVFGSGYIRLHQMMKVGFVMNLIAIALITLVAYYIVPMIVRLP